MKRQYGFVWLCTKCHICNGKTVVIYVMLHQSTLCVDANNNGLHAGTDISEIPKSGSVWFCKAAHQLLAKRSE